MYYEGSDIDTSDTDTDESDVDDDEEIWIEQELRTECVADIVTPNSFTTVFHHQNLLNCFIFARLSLLIQHQIWWYMIIDTLFKKVINILVVII